MCIRDSSSGSSDDSADDTIDTPTVAADALETEGDETAGNTISADDTDSENQLLNDADTVVDMTFDPVSTRASYRVTVRNFWSAEEYPEGFPEDAHFSFIGGAVHDSSYSMWEFGEPPSTGIEDMAETGRIDILLFDEVAPFVEPVSYTHLTLPTTPYV